MKQLYDMLQDSAQADRSKALLTLELLGNRAAGIGDHSTGDYYKNAEEALSILVDAEDRLSVLAMHFEDQTLIVEEEME